MKKNYPILSKSVLLPFVLVTSLFALWGFANSITDPMVTAFKKVLELSNSQASWVQMAFYGGYFCMALPASLFIRKYSYKVGILIGLALYAVGALLFFPAAEAESFAFFCLGLYVLTFGLAFLETVANPYVLSMGHPSTATQRLNLAQAFTPAGLIAGIFIAKEFVLKNLQSDDMEYFSEGLDDVSKTLFKASDLALIRDPYVVLGLIIIGIFILFIGIRIEKPKDKKQQKQDNIGNTVKVLLKDRKYIFGVVAQILYVGTQIMCWTYIYQYAEGIGMESVTAIDYQIGAFVLFAVGRALGTYLLRFVSSGSLLMSFALGGGLLTIGTIFIHSVVGLYCLVGISLFMSVMFPTIYGVALSGLNQNQAKLGSAGLIMAIVGGAGMPMLQASIIDVGGRGVADTTIWGVPEVNFSFILPLACLVYVCWYGISVAKKKDI